MKAEDDKSQTPLGHFCSPVSSDGLLDGQRLYQEMYAKTWIIMICEIPGCVTFAEFHRSIHDARRIFFYTLDFLI